MCVWRVCFWIGVPPRQPRPYFHAAGFSPGLRSKVSLLVPGFPVDRARVVGQRVDARPVDVDGVLGGLADGAVVAGAGERDAFQVGFADLLRGGSEQRQRIDVARRERLRAHEHARQSDRDDSREESVHASPPGEPKGSRHKRDCADRTAAAADQLQRRGDDDRAGRRQPIEIAQAGQAELAVAVHDVVIRKRRIESCRPGPHRCRSFPRRRRARRDRSRAAATSLDRIPGACGPSSRTLRNAAPDRRAPSGSQQHPRAARNAAVRVTPISRAPATSSR